METKQIIITQLEDVNKFANICSHCKGCVEVRKGKWIVDASSIMGLMSIDLSKGASIVYSVDEVTSDFIEFVNSHLI